MRDPIRAPILLMVIVGMVAAAAVVVVPRLGRGSVSDDAPVGRIDAPVPPFERRVVFVPFDDFPADEARALIDHYEQRYGLRVELADPIALPADAFDRERGQIMAEALVEALRTTTIAGADPRAVLIGLTDEDLFFAGRPEWRYTFGVRSAGTLAVVSSSRMATLGSSAELEGSRLRKMVTKDLGLLYYGLPLSDDPRSVLYSNVLGPDDLDRMSEDF